MRESSNSTFFTSIVFSFVQTNYSVWIEREKSGTDGEKFPEGGSFDFLKGEDKSLEIVAYLDHSVIEVFFQRGSYVTTSRVYPPEEFESISIFSVGNDELLLQNLQIWKLKSCWNEN